MGRSEKAIQIISLFIYNVVRTCYTSNARRDIQDAIEWENMRKLGLANRMLHNVDRKLLVVSKTPYIFSIRYANIRCVVTDVFQYLIHYTIDEANKKVIVLRILSTAREPIW